MRGAVVLFAMAACYRPGAQPECIGGDCVDGGSGDGDVSPPDGDGPPQQVCAGTAAGLLGELCFDAPFTPETFDGVRQIDTSNDLRCQSSAPPGVCLVITNGVVGTLTATGTRPLVLWSPSTMVIAGVVDASSHFNSHGPGLEPTTCPATSSLAGVFDSAEVVGGGGAGGSFGTRGGAGGSVASTLANGGTSIAFTDPTPRTLHAGCGGGRGGNNAVINNAGFGGGALYLMAADAIVIDGGLNASGGAAAPATARRGGGGGGSGGLIGLDAPIVTANPSAVILALGGGGGPGGDAASAQETAGQEPFLVPTFVAPRTQNENCASTFSFGAASGADGGPGTNQATLCAGGGGGGGAGLIEAFQTPLVVEIGATVLPPEKSTN